MLYKFDNFEPSSLPSIFIDHSDDLGKFWHQRFGHLNYQSLQQLCKQILLTSLLLVSCRDGIFSSCVLDKHHWDSFDIRTS
jgi:hypothetical protein